MKPDKANEKDTQSTTACDPHASTNFTTLPTELRFSILEMAVADLPPSPLGRTTYTRLVNRYDLRDLLDDETRLVVDAVNQDVRREAMHPIALRVRDWEVEMLRPFTNLQTSCRQVYLDLEALECFPNFLRHRTMNIDEMEALMDEPEGTVPETMVLQLFTIHERGHAGHHPWSNTCSCVLRTGSNHRMRNVDCIATYTLNRQAKALHTVQRQSLHEEDRRDETYQVDHLREFMRYMNGILSHWTDALYHLAKRYGTTRRRLIICTDILDEDVNTWVVYDLKRGSEVGLGDLLDYREFYRFFDAAYWLVGRGSVKVIGTQPQADLLRLAQAMAGARPSSGLLNRMVLNSDIEAKDDMLTPRLSQALRDSTSRLESPAWWMENKSDKRKAGCCRSECPCQGEGCCF